MTNQELRELVQTWKLTDECPYPGATDAILRLLDEHQQMKEALWYYAANYTGGDLAEAVLASLKDDES